VQSLQRLKEGKKKQGTSKREGTASRLGEGRDEEKKSLGAQEGEVYFQRFEKKKGRKKGGTKGGP